MHRFGHDLTKERTLYRATSTSGPLRGNVPARTTIDESTGHIMTLEYTKHTSGEDVHLLPKLYCNSNDTSSPITSDPDPTVETVVPHLRILACLHNPYLMTSATLVKVQWSDWS